MTRDANRAYLEVGDVRHEGWLSVSVQRSIEQAAAQFQVSLTETWPGQANPIKVHPGDPCRVLIGDDLIVTGYADAVQLAHSGSDHTVSISGRSKTEDVVDCSCEASKSKPAQWKGRTVLQIAQAVCKPYGVEVVCDVPDLPSIKSYVAKVGDRAFDAIEQVCREQRLLVTDTREGKLLLTRVGSQTGPAFIHPGNILSSSLRADVSRRFSKYVVKGQAQGDDDNFGEGVAGVEDSVEDLQDLARYRLLVIKGEKAMGKAQAGARANWEAVTRAGRSAAVEITVAGWRDEHGRVYDVNRLCKVQDPVIGVDATLLSVSVRFLLDDRQGQVTQIELAPAGAYEPELPKKQKVTGGIHLYQVHAGVH
jgi:prophage tail gpP-like protein